MLQVREAMFAYLNTEAQEHGQQQCPLRPEMCGKVTIVDGHAKVRTFAREQGNACDLHVTYM